MQRGYIIKLLLNVSLHIKVYNRYNILNQQMDKSMFYDPIWHLCRIICPTASLGVICGLSARAHLAQGKLQTQCYSDMEMVETLP